MDIEFSVIYLSYGEVFGSVGVIGYFNSQSLIYQNKLDQILKV